MPVLRRWRYIGPQGLLDSQLVYLAHFRSREDLVSINMSGV